MRSIGRLSPVIAVVVALIALASGCDRSGTSAPLTAGRYITIAMEAAERKAAGLDLVLFPKSAGTQRCVIRVGPPPGGVWVPTTCMTTVLIRGNDEATVRFVQRWSARHFDADPGRRVHLSHTWEITVKRNGTDVEAVRIRDYGDFPPQLVR
jgi:hypothetical protein